MAKYSFAKDFAGFAPLAHPSTVLKHGLIPGMVVRTPDFIIDDTGRHVPIDEVWPRHDRYLLVTRWDWEEGESALHGPTGHLDSNVLDYPEMFEVWGFARGAIKDYYPEPNPRTTSLARRMANP